MREWTATVVQPKSDDPTLDVLAGLTAFERHLLETLKGGRFVVRFDGPPFDPVPAIVAQAIAASGVIVVDPIDPYDFAHDFLDVEETTPAGGGA